MKVANVGAVAVVCSLALLVGCSEDQITQIFQTKGAIYGRVESNETGVRVEAWQAELIKAVTADDEGYFTIDELDPGKYRVKVQSPDGLGREIYDVEVDVGRGRDLETITLLYALPLNGFDPADGEEDVAPSDDIWIYTSTRLDMESLERAVSAAPEIEGSWIEYQDYPGGSYSYRFQPGPQLAAGTHYVVTVGSGLTPTNGEPWGKTASLSFMTAEMTITQTSWYSSPPPGELSPTYTGQLVQFYFNTLIDQNSIGQAVSILPPVDYEITQGSQPNNGFGISLQGGLVSGTEYEITMTQGLEDVLGGHLFADKKFKFSTKPFEVENRSFPNGHLNISPRLNQYSSELLSFDYSTGLDPASATSAVSINPPVALSITIDSYDDSRLRVSAPDGLRPATTYTLTIGGLLRAGDGAYISSPELIQFETEPLLVEDFRVMNQSSFGNSDTTIDPGTSFIARVWVNADVDADAFGDAASFDPPIDGFWYFQPNYPEGYLEFFTTSNPNLTPGTTYSLTIDGSVPVAGDVGFGSNVIKRFVVNPVAVTALSPAPGDRQFWIYYDITVRFNSPMDHATTEAAFALTTGDGTPVAGNFYWSNSDTELRFDPFQLDVGVTYFASVNTSAMSQSGAPLGEAVQTFFQVRN